jgi:DNA-binding FadR family transcriptional regulator
MTSILDLGTIRHDEVNDFGDLMEVPSARLAAQNRTQEDLAAMSQVIEREKAVDVGDPGVPELNAEFHTALASPVRTGSWLRLFPRFTALHIRLPSSVPIASWGGRRASPHRDLRCDRGAGRRWCRAEDARALGLPGRARGKAPSEEEGPEDPLS